MNKQHIIISLAIALLLSASCGKYISQMNKTQAALSVFTHWLNGADTIATENAKKKYFEKQLCLYSKCNAKKKNPVYNRNFPKKYKGKKTRKANAEVLTYLSLTKLQPDTITKFIASICDSGFFIRTFEMDKSEMFYRFNQPNAQALGIMFLSDRYKKDFIDRKSGTNKFFIRDYDYVFPRIYFIRENKIHILSGDLDLGDRKVFERMGVESDTIFEKNSTYRRDNNDKIYDLNYHFKYVTYSDVEKRWQRVAEVTDDSSYVTKDVGNYIDYELLKNIMVQQHVSSGNLNVNLNDTVVNGKWFFGGTMDDDGKWIQNNTSLHSEKTIWTMMEDTAKYFFVNNRMYYRTKEPGDFKPETEKQKYKGEITGSINVKDRVFIRSYKKIMDKKGNYSVWFELRKIIRKL